MQETEKIWMNGELVDWADARIHVGAHGLHYGTGVFEGIRCYATERGPAVFRLVTTSTGSTRPRAALHGAAVYDRGAPRGLLRRPSPQRPRGLLPAADRVLRLGDLGVHCGENPVDVAIICFPWGAYLGETS